MAADTPLISWIPLTFTIFSAVASLVVRQMDHPKEEYLGEVKDIQKDRWNDVCGELGPIVADVVEFVEDKSNDHTQENLARGAKASMVLRKVLNDRDDLGDLESKLDAVDVPKREYRRCRRYRKRSFLIFIAAFSGFGIASVMFYFSPQTLITALIETVIFTLSGCLMMVAALAAKESLDAREVLDEMTEEKDFM